MEASFEAETICLVCSAEFLDAEDLTVHIAQVHQSSNSPQRAFSIHCHFCLSDFTNIVDYAVHIRDVHITSLKCCKYCTRLFTDHESLLEHQSKHKIFAEKSLISCSQCREMFNRNHLDQHEFSEHGDVNEGVMLNAHFSILSSVLNMNAYSFFHSLESCKVYSCICNYSNGDIQEYVNHLKQNNCQSHVCENCLHVYKNIKNMKRHLANKTCHNKIVESKRTCKQCLKRIPAWNYGYHIQLCKMAKCNICLMTFKTLDELQTHQLEKHPKAIVMTSCKFCRREFVGTVAHDRHMNRIHKPHLHKYKYKCVHCENRYYMHPKDMFAHFYSKHAELKPYACKICDMHFRVRKKFTIHIKMVHDSKGFVEFDENYNVFFSATKSENPFQPTSLFGSPQKEQDDNSETEVETDVQTDAQTDVQTDMQTETEQNIPKTQKTIAKKPLKVRFKEQDKAKLKTKDFVLTETEPDEQSEIDTKQKENRRVSQRIKMKHEQITDTELEDSSKEDQKPKINVKRRSSFNTPFLKKELLSNMDEIIGNSEGSSEDEPLLKVKKREKLKKYIRNGRKTKFRTGQKSRKKLNKDKHKFTCTICKKYCYTFQNFHHHISLHFKDEAKKCVKCDKQFPTKSELLRHIDNDHKSSRLTETLKNMLERRKQNDEKTELTNVEKFQRTIKRVNVPASKVVAKITEVKDKLNAKNFLESFVPDDGALEKNSAEKPTCDIQTCVSVCMIDRPIMRAPVIKMTKFVPKPMDYKTHLALPVPFKETNKEKQNVRVTLIRNVTSDNDADYNVNDYHNDDNGMDHYEEVVENSERTETVIPDVAEEQEVAAEEPSEKTYNIPHTLVLPKDYLSTTHKTKIRIAHMLPEKPYFKIIKMEDVFMKNEPEMKPTGPIELANGTKLVNVNPLAHLMGNRHIEDIIGKPAKQKKRKCGGRIDVQAAIAKALQKLEVKKDEARRERTKKTDKVEQNNDVNNSTDLRT